MKEAAGAPSSIQTTPTPLIFCLVITYLKYNSARLAFKNLLHNAFLFSWAYCLLWVSPEGNKPSVNTSIFLRIPKSSRCHEDSIQLCPFKRLDSSYYTTILFDGKHCCHGWGISVQMGRFKIARPLLHNMMGQGLQRTWGSSQEWAVSNLTRCHRAKNKIWESLMKLNKS